MFTRRNDQLPLLLMLRIQCFSTPLPRTEHITGMCWSLPNISSSAPLYKQSECSGLGPRTRVKGKRGAICSSRAIEEKEEVKKLFILFLYTSAECACICCLWLCVCVFSQLYLHRFPHGDSSQVGIYTCKSHPDSDKFLHHMCLDSLRIHWCLSKKGIHKGYNVKNINITFRGT